MKVLWFTNTPCSAVEKLNMNFNLGGWLPSLERELNKIPHMELAICFYYSKRIKPFDYKGTRYFPVYRQHNNSKLGRFLNRLFPKHDDKKELKELLQIVKQFSPDIIHVHGTEDNFGLIQCHTDIPVVISIQGILSPYAEKYFAGIPRSVVSRYEGLRSKLLIAGAARSYAEFCERAKRERWILKNAKFVIGRTDWDKRITRLLAPESRYFVGNEVLREPFYENVWDKASDNTIQIVTTTSDALYKGFESVVDAAQILKDKTDLKFLWKVIGLNERSNSVKIVKNWKNINTENLHIKLLGSMDGNEIVNLLLQSDIYCQISHIENSPNSLCEAMMCGMPIVATFAGGVNSLMLSDKEGILIQDGDPYSLVSAIIKLAGNRQIACDYGNNARNRALKRHDKLKIVSELLDIYDSIAKPRVGCGCTSQ